MNNLEVSYHALSSFHLSNFQKMMHVNNMGEVVFVPSGTSDKIQMDMGEMVFFFFWLFVSLSFM